MSEPDTREAHVAIRARAEQTTEWLFVNGQGQRADRLVLSAGFHRDLGGWCRGAVTDAIEAALLAVAAEATAAEHARCLKIIGEWLAGDQRGAWQLTEAIEARPAGEPA